MELNFMHYNLSIENVTLSGDNIRQDLIDQYLTNRNIEDPAYHILIIMYSILILVGATGNSLVVMAVVRKPQMRTARNMFIVNLAVSGRRHEEGCSE
jgi:neuropeptide Y receptor